MLRVSAVTAVLFDFDGTLSTLRHGWEKVMEPMMTELLGEERGEEVRAYINESAGIQTIHQMKWLAGQVAVLRGKAEDPWFYKTEYNRRLMEIVTRRMTALRREDHLIAGSEALLETLCRHGIDLYAASGTDDPDVRNEAAALGLTRYFKRIAGAPLGVEDCSKESVMRELISSGIPSGRLAVVGDGKVEIAIGRGYGARTLGIASDEAARHGIDPVKRERLIGAGADMIAGDFLDIDGIMKFLLGN
jgi:phosphoglycolate phosphatase-like HAD superfamily hydrolase